MKKNTIVWVLLVLLVLLFLLDLGVEAAVYDGSILLPVQDLLYPLSQVSQNHRLITIQMNTRCCFSRKRGFLFTITLKQKPKGITRILSVCLVVQRGMACDHLGFCLRFIVKENS